MMASIYFENIDFYRNLVSLPLSEAEQEQDQSPVVQLVNEFSDTTICSRIRPLSQEEQDLQHTSGVVVNGSSKAVIFEPRVKFNGTPDVNKSQFSLDRVYDADTKTESLYQDIAHELVPQIWAGGVSTLFAYGQTGSGKTYTVTGIANLVIKDIMAMAEVDSRDIYVCCFEILGKKVYDLLDNRRVFSIMEDSFGTMQLVGVQEKQPTSESEFLSIIQTSSLLRTSAPTSKNYLSSRSHAVYRIRAVNRADPQQLDGEIFLVDLAGSEGSQDSMNHSPERMAETKEINVSLANLKDCIRTHALWGFQQLQTAPSPKKSIHIPWRSNKLTQVLKHVFATDGDRFCKNLVIACVGPSIVDSSHSRNTLRYAEYLKVPVPKAKVQIDLDSPTGWTNEKAKQWITENSGTSPIDANVLVGDLTGIQLCKLPHKEFISRCVQTEGVTNDQAAAFYQKLWRFRIDCRKLSSLGQGNVISETIQDPPKERDKTPFKQRITSGMFVRLKPCFSKLVGGDIVMVMSPSGPEDFEGTGEDRKFVCALVGPSIMADAYELHVSMQHTYRVKNMAEEVLMEYDNATRYYYMDV